MSRNQGLLLIAAIFGSFWFLSKYRIEGLDRLRIVSRASSPWEESAPQGVIRVASFHITCLEEPTAPSVKTQRLLAETLRRFDLVAIQGIRGRSDEVLRRIVQQLSTGERQYDLVMGPRVGRGSEAEQLAFCFERGLLEVDRQTVHPIADPKHLLKWPPLAASFRVRGPSAGEAFTFTAVNVHADPKNPAELETLAQVEGTVRRDGRGEDDVILLGDFGVTEQFFGRLSDIPNLEWIVGESSAASEGEETTNILFSRVATTEFAGKSGILDLVRQFNLTREDARQLSAHLPVWAEFNVLEALPSQVATQPDDVVR
jgi:hypothetical protein